MFKLRLYKLILVACLLVAFVSYIYPVSIVSAQDIEASAAISAAQIRILNCYRTAQTIEGSGANVSKLTLALNNAGILLSKANQTYNAGDFLNAKILATKSQGQLSNFETEASLLKTAEVHDQNTNLIIIIGSAIGTISVIVGGFLLWKLLRKKRALSLKFDALLILLTCVFSLLAASPLLQRILFYPQTNSFTEFSILGPEHMASGYPNNISVNETYRVFIEITNNLGSLSYYQIQVKFRNETQSAPSALNRTPSSLPSLYNLNVFVDDKMSMELPMSFSFNYSKVGENKIEFNEFKLNVENLSMNNLSSEWNSERNAFYGNLFFELWVYDTAKGSFQYNERSLSLILNMTI